MTSLMHMRGLASYKTMFNQSFSTYEKCLYKVRNMTGVFHSFDVYELLILQFGYGLSVLNLARFGVFFL